MRVHEFSKKYNIPNKIIIDVLNKHEFEVKTHMSVVSNEAITFLKEYFDTDHKKKKKKKKGANLHKTKGNKEDRISNIPVVNEEENNVIFYKDNITVGNVAEQLNKSASKVIKSLMSLGIMANVNQVIDRDAVE